tara:strand:- start:3308 stop:4255 length:948 start_codon:yes stop_codon:yes gene_type:complete
MSEFPDNPSRIRKLYDSGYEGAKHDPQDVARLMGELRHPVFGIAASAGDLYEDVEGVLAKSYESYLSLDPKAFSEQQTEGSCVGHATRNAVDATRAIEILIRGETEGWVARGATEGIYGSREHRSSGMYCSSAARFMEDTGGILLRKDYDFADLSVLNDAISQKWGGGRMPDAVYREGKRHQVRTVSLVSTTLEAMVALHNGYVISSCGSQSWSSTRNDEGISKETRSGWAHAITIIGYDDTRLLDDDTLWILANSWGTWNRGGHPSWGKLPVGCWLSRNRPIVNRLKQNGSYAYSDVDGFEPRRLPDMGATGHV